MLARGFYACALALASLIQAAPVPQEKTDTVSRGVSLRDAELESRYIYTQRQSQATEEQPDAELESRYIYTQRQSQATEEQPDAELESR